MPNLRDVDDFLGTAWQLNCVADSIRQTSTTNTARKLKTPTKQGDLLARVYSRESGSQPLQRIATETPPRTRILGENKYCSVQQNNAIASCCTSCNIGGSLLGGNILKRNFSLFHTVLIFDRNVCTNIDV